MAEHHIPEHSSPIKTPRQLVIVLVLAFVVPIAVIVILVKLATSGMDTSRQNPAFSDEAIAQRLRPVGEVAVDPSQPKPEPAAPPAVAAALAPVPPPAAPAAKPDAAQGQQVYAKACTACHTPGIAGAPRTGDKLAWALRLKLGMETLYASAIKGKGAMPPKGGNLALSDAEVKAAVDYMVGRVK